MIVYYDTSIIGTEKFPTVRTYDVSVVILYLSS